MSLADLRQRFILSGSACLLATTLAACGSLTGSDLEDPSGLAACGSAPFLTVSPAALSDVTAIVPLGNLNPSGHTFPTDHVYFIVPLSGGGFGDPVSIPVVSPGEVRLTGVASSTNNQSGPTRTDYSLYFYGCADVQFYFHHIQTLAPTLAAAIGSVQGDCQTYSTGGGTYTRCNKTLDIPLYPGEAIGTAGGPGNFAFDLGAYDRRTQRLAFVNHTFPDFGGNEFNMYHTVCPLDYFAPTIKASLEAKLGNGRQARTLAPTCGTIMQDVANTAQGRWLNGSGQSDDTHLALVHDNVDPTIGAISMGTSVPSIPPGVYKFTPASSAATRVNTDFSAVTPNGQIYCYGEFSTFGSNTHVLAQLVTASSLKIQGLAGATCGSESTWSFSAGAVTFLR